MSIDCILCPVDFSDASRHATQYATAIATLTGARIIALHVHQPALATIPAVVGRDDPIAQPLAAGSADVRARIAAQFVHGRFDSAEVIPEVVVGEPAETIADRARIERADVIIIGTRGAGGLQHLLLGSVTEDVIRKSTAPVLAVPPHAAAMPDLPFTRVLCAVDLSASSLSAIQMCQRLLGHRSPAVTLLHVVDDPAENELFLARPYDVHRHAGELETRVRASVREVTAPLFAGRRSPDIRVAHGRASEQILSVASEIGAELIVMGVHGRKALGVAIFGSTTNDVLRRATCPVLASV
jgi:nucleotide-binding universal stress UspA family protein